MKLFSLPFNALMSIEDLKARYLPFVEKYKEYIDDIYFSLPMAPFENDAMGQASKLGQSQINTIFNLMLSIQKQYGIKASATFNNVTVAPTYENKEIFLKNFDTLYEMGLRSITLPHIHWMLDGQIKRLYPDLIVKNTVLRRVNSPQNYVDYVKAGFDVVNIDRVNLRDRDNLKKLKKAYDRYKVPMAILVNEGCRGRCPAMDEHYTLNCQEESISYFNQKVAQNTCATWRQTDKSYHLKVANMPVWREDFEELRNFVQILKLHGRSEISVLKSSMKIIESYANGGATIGEDWSEKYGYDEKELKKWREFTKNCKFECWDCKMCDELTATAKGLVF